MQSVIQNIHPCSSVYIMCAEDNTFLLHPRTSSCTLVPAPAPYQLLHPTSSCTLPAPVPYQLLYPTSSCTLPAPVPYQLLHPTSSYTLVPAPVPHQLLHPTSSCTLPAPAPYQLLHPTSSCTPPAPVLSQVCKYNGTKLDKERGVAWYTGQQYKLMNHIFLVYKFFCYCCRRVLWKLCRCCLLLSPPVGGFSDTLHCSFSSSASLTSYAQTHSKLVSCIAGQLSCSPLPCWFQVHVMCIKLNPVGSNSRLIINGPHFP